MNSQAKAPNSFGSGGRALHVGGATFAIYLYFLVDFFLHFTARIPGYGVVRPTLLVALIVCALLIAQRDKLSGRGKDPVFKALIALIVYIGVTLPLVEWPGSIIRNNLSDFVKAVLFLFFTALIVDTEQRLRKFLWVFVGCQVIRVLEPLFLHITQGYWGSRTHLGHGDFAQRLAGAPSDVINPNELGFVIVTAIPFLHYLVWPAGKKGKALYLLLMPCLLYALVLTMSRGAFIALLVVAFMVFKESRHKFGLSLLAVLVVIGSISVMTPVQKDRYLSLVDEDAVGAASVDGRLSGMVKEFKLGLQRPIVGHGLGTTPEAKANILGNRRASHNLYAEIFIELGIVGAIFFLIFLWQIYRRSKRNRKILDSFAMPSDGFYMRLNRAMIAVFWMYLVYSLNYWGLSQYYWYLFGGLVVAVGHLLGNKERNEQIGGSTQDAGVKVRFPLAARYNSSLSQR